MQNLSNSGWKPFRRAALALALLGLTPLADPVARTAGSKNRSTIRGTVVGDRGPIAGATVRIQTTDTATRTTAGGQFALPVEGVNGRRLDLTAWAPGYYCGGPVGVTAGRQDVRIQLRAHFAADNPGYSWLSANSVVRTADGQGCAACHSRADTSGLPRLPVEEWRLDAHSRSAVNALSLSMYQGTDIEGNRSPATRWARNRDYGAFPLLPDPTRPYFGPGYKLDFPNSDGNCACCHVPAAAAAGDPYGVNPARISGIALGGVTCDFCHKIWAVLRENSVATDFVGFVGFWTPCFRHEDSAPDGGRAVSQSGRLRVVQSGGRTADPHAQAATHRLQAQVEETNAKQGAWRKNSAAH